MTETYESKRQSEKEVQTFQQYRVELVREGAPLGRVANPHQARVLLQRFVNGSPRELFMVTWLDTRNQVTGFEIVTTGTLNGSLVHPREVFQGAILANAAGVIVVHNHPSGDPNPSREDIQLIQRLWEAGDLLGITLLDSIIITHQRSFSFKEMGILPNRKEVKP